MHFGIQCGDGWFSLIDTLLHRVQVHADEVVSQPVVLPKPGTPKSGTGKVWQSHKAWCQSLSKPGATKAWDSH